MGSTKTENESNTLTGSVITKTENESNTLTGSVINSVQSSGKKIIGNVTAKNCLKESLSSILCFIIQGKGSSWKRFDPEIYFVAILRRVRIFDTIEFLVFTHVI